MQNSKTQICLFLVFFLIVNNAIGFEFGIGVHVRDNQSKFWQVYPAIKSAGFSSFRDEIYMARVEQTKGLYSIPPGLADLDTLITKANLDGVKPLIALDYGNKFYDDGDIITSDVGRAAFAKYAKFVTSHYKGKIQLFEVWNEYNIGMGSSRKPRTLGTPDNYVKLLKETYMAVKSVNPTATVIAGAVCGLDDKWIDEFIKLGGLKYADAFSVHPYVIMNAPNDRPETAIGWLDNLNKKIQVANSGKSLPIYITEMGWPTNLGKYGVSESQQSAYFTRFNLLAASRPEIAGVWWYTLIDGGINPMDKESRFGLLNNGLSSKPAFIAARNLSNILRNYNLKEVVLNEAKEVKAVIATGKDDTRVYVWSELENYKRKLNLDMKQLNISNFIFDNNSDINIEITNVPKEIIFKDNKLDFSDY